MSRPTPVACNAVDVEDAYTRFAGPARVVVGARYGPDAADEAVQDAAVWLVAHPKPVISESYFIKLACARAAHAQSAQQTRRRREETEHRSRLAILAYPPRKPTHTPAKKGSDEYGLP